MTASLAFGREPDLEILPISTTDTILANRLPKNAGLIVAVTIDDKPAKPKRWRPLTKQKA
jgi:hypothetical protein